jgi:hypothetical protein
MIFSSQPKVRKEAAEDLPLLPPLPINNLANIRAIINLRADLESMRNSARYLLLFTSKSITFTSKSIRFKFVLVEGLVFLPHRLVFAHFASKSLNHNILRNST